jgi:sulfate permease, SulP family
VSERRAERRAWRVPAIPRPGGAVAACGWAGVPREVLPALVLVALSVPMNIGYASVAGLPATAGVYASIAPLVVFALTTGSRRLVVGPDATVAALLAVAVVPVVAGGVAPTEAALAVALLTGVALLLGWLIGLGRLVRFLSSAVLVGFIAGLAIEILTSQVRRIMGISVEAEGWVLEVAAMVAAIPEASVASVLVGVGTIAIVRLLRRSAPGVPAALVALLVVGGAVAWLRPDGVALLGPVPAGLPPLRLPALPAEAWLALVPVALAIALLTVAEGVLISQRAARRHGEVLEPNGEVFAYGVSNVAAAVTGGMPIGASASRSAALEETGARTQVPMVVAAVVAAVVVVAFVDILAAIPMAALGGLVANAVVGLIDLPAWRHLARVRRSEVVVAAICALGVLLLGPLQGLALAAVASAVDVVRRAADLPWARLSGLQLPAELGRFARDGDDAVPSGLVALRPEGPLFFANAATVRDLLERVAQEPGTRWLLLDLEAVTDVDPTAAEALADGIGALRAAGRVVALSRARAPTAALLQRYGLLDAIDPDRVFPTNRAAAAAYREAAAPASRADDG